MCFPVYECFFCVSLDVAAKCIGIFYMILGAGLTVLFGVPVTLAWEVLPLLRSCFYAAMTVSSAALCLTSFLLTFAAFTSRPSLMRPWVGCAWATSAPLAAICVAGMATLPLRYSSANDAADESCVISVYFVHACLLFYFSCVVNSRRRELEREENPKVLEGLIYPTIHNQYRAHI